MQPDFVSIGSLILDDLYYDGQARLSEPGGALLYSSLAASLCHFPVGIVTVCGSDYPRSMLKKLQDRGIHIGGVRYIDQAAHHWQAIYGEQGQDRGAAGGTPLVDASPVASDFPSAWVNARAIQFTPSPLNQQVDFVRRLRKESQAFLSLDPLYPIDRETRKDYLALVSDLDAFFPSEYEVRLSEFEGKPEALMKYFAVGRVRFVGLKRGAAGALLYDRAADRFYQQPAILQPTDVVDPTGGGDSFCAGFLATFLRTGNIERSLQMGSVLASFTLQAWGAKRLFEISSADVMERFKRLFVSM